MRDPFQAARIAHQQAQLGAVGQQATAMPQAPASPGAGPAPMPESPVNFAPLAKKFGLDKVKFDKNPVVARTQLMQHLKTNLGTDYMKHPGVPDLLKGFSQHHLNSSQNKAMHALSSGAQQNMKSLMG